MFKSFYNAIREVSFEDVFKVIDEETKDLDLFEFSDRKILKEKYHDLFNRLLELDKPTEYGPGYIIVVKFIDEYTVISDDDIRSTDYMQYYDASRVISNEEIPDMIDCLPESGFTFQSLGYNPIEEWITLKIGTKCIDAYGLSTVIAACLIEMGLNVSSIHDVKDEDDIDDYDINPDEWFDDDDNATTSPTQITNPYSWEDFVHDENLDTSAISFKHIILMSEINKKRRAQVLEDYNSEIIE